MKYLMAMIAVIATVSNVRAQTFTEQDFLRQAKFCESATRLPWGDVDHYTFLDCMNHHGNLRSEDERKRNSSYPTTRWARAWNESLLSETEDGCASWAKNQPENSPQMHKLGIWTHNHAWNLCMEQQGIFAKPASRPPTPKEPDFQTMAAEQRTMTILGDPKEPGQFFGCYTYERYVEIGMATRLEYVQGRTVFPDISKQRKLIEDSSDCRYWKAGERVQVKAYDNKEHMLCLSRAGSTDRCYWTFRTAINKWE